MRQITYLIKKKYGTIKEFCEVCGIPHCTMHHYLNNFRFPNTHNFMTIASKLDVTAEWLYSNWYREVKE